MAKPNEINERIKKGYIPKENNNQAQSDASADCINYCCTGDFFVPLKEFEQIIYSGKIGTKAGKIKIKKPGFFPYAKFFWRDTIAIVDTRPKTINYPNKNYLIKDQFEADVNAYVTYQVFDVEKYYESSQNVLEELNQKVQMVFRGYFSDKEFEKLNAKTTSLKDEIGLELNQLIEDIGIKINDIGYTECKLPKSLMDDAEQKKVQELAHKRQEKERDFQQEQSILKQKFQNETMDPLLDTHEKTVAARQADSDTTKLIALKNIITDLPPEQQAEVIKAYMYANSNNNNINIVDTNYSHKSK